jgi:hypothetical protein
MKTENAKFGSNLSHNGATVVLAQQAYIDSDANNNAAYFAAANYATDADDAEPTLMVEWTISSSSDDESNTCDWDAPTSIKNI